MRAQSPPVRGLGSGTQMARVSSGGRADATASTRRLVLVCAPQAWEAREDGASSWGLTYSWVPFPLIAPGLFWANISLRFIQPVQGQGEALTVPHVSGQGPALSKVHSANSY